MIDNAQHNLDLVNKLRRGVPFSSLNDAQFQALLAASELVSCKLGTGICEQGKPAPELYVLISGKIRLTIHNDRERDSTLCTFTRPGDFFGGEISSEAHNCAFTARASSDSVLLRIPATTVNQTIATSDAFRKHLNQSKSLWDWHKHLFGLPAFDEINYWQLHSMLLRCSELDLKTAQQASEVDGVCIVLAGAVEVLEGKTKRNAEFGDVLAPSSGLSTIGSSGVSKLCITALADSRLLILPRDGYDDLARYNPQLATDLDQLLTAPRINAQHLDHASADTRSAQELLSNLMTATGVQPIEPERPKLLIEEPLIPRVRRKFRQYPILYQQNAMDCGATCLGMICLFYGKRVSLNQLRSICRVGAYGTSLLSLAEAAERLGFISRGMRATYSGLLKLKPPLICFWENKHFVVLFEIRETHAIVGDPADGLVRIERAKFSKLYSEAVLELTPTQEFGKGFKSQSALVRLIPLITPFLPLIRNIFIASLIFQCLMLVMPMFTQVIVDKVVVHQNISMLNMMLLGMVLFSLFETAVSFMRGFLLAFLSMKADQSLIVQLYRHLLSLPLKFFEERTIGDLLARFGENQKIRDFVSGAGITVILDALFTVVYFGIICLYNISFGMAVAVYLILFVALIVAYTPLLKQLSRRVFNKHVESNSFLVESLMGIEKIKAAAAEHRTRWKWEILFTDTLNVKFHELLAVNATQTLSRLVQLAGQVLLLWLGANLVIQQKLTVGQLMALNMLIGMVTAPVMRIVEMWDHLQDVNISLERLGDILEAEPEEPDPAKKIKLPQMRGAIKFEAVTFRYSDLADSNVLSNVSFEVSPGQMVAIVGRSGSGKTSILKLLQGLYLPVSGRIYIDGRDITQVYLTQLRKNIGVVSQHEYLFRGSVRENLSLYKPEASLEEMIEAATIAGVHDFINQLPNGYDTPLNEGGFNLSGGQRQRLAIARAILHRPKILIFDEATSALDSESERRIQNAMEHIRKDRTMFVVAHRLSTVTDADVIIVIDRGQIVEQGTHESLVAERGLYYYLCNQQLNL